MTNCAYEPCGKQLVRRADETATNFKRRVHCDRKCQTDRSKVTHAKLQLIEQRGNVECKTEGCSTILRRQRYERSVRFLNRTRCLECKPVFIRHRGTGSTKLGRPLLKAKPVKDFNSLMMSMKVIK